MMAKRDIHVGGKAVVRKGSTCIIEKSKLSNGYSVLTENGRLLYITTWWNIIYDFYDIKNISGNSRTTFACPEGSIC